MIAKHNRLMNIGLSHTGHHRSQSLFRAGQGILRRKWDTQWTPDSKISSRSSSWVGLSCHDGIPGKISLQHTQWLTRSWEDSCIYSLLSLNRTWFILPKADAYLVCAEHSPARSTADASAPLLLVGLAVFIKEKTEAAALRVEDWSCLEGNGRVMFVPFPWKSER